MTILKFKKKIRQFFCFHKEVIADGYREGSCIECDKLFWYKDGWEPL